MLQLNEFYEGIDTDTDQGKIKNTRTRDSVNMRVTDMHGHNIVKTNISGNTIAFSITAGFKPMGKIETELGFAVIFSFNSTTGEGEIGTYPSPNGINGFNNVYAPLKNLNGGNYMRSTELNFSCAHPILSGFVRKDADDSYNIYFNDNYNPDRVVNSGFTVNGATVSRPYTTSSLKKMINLFLNTPVHAAVTLDTVQSGGQHKAGTYIYYFRLLTKTFDKTPFIFHSGPVNISPDADNGDAALTAKGQIAGYITSKAVRLNLIGLDTDFDFIEVGSVYYFDDNSRTISLINKRYPITGTTENILITDSESKVELTYDELLYRHPSDQRSRTIEQFESILFRGNTNEDNDINDAYLLAFSNLIKITYDVLDVPISTPEFGEGEFYRNLKMKYDYVGYFRGETYPFAVEYILTNGITTNSYPLKGNDEWSSTTLATNTYQNINGIYRFPCEYDEQLGGVLNNYGVKKDWVTGVGTLANARVLAVMFDLTDAKAYIAANPLAGAYFEKWIKGIYFTRGKRKPNLIYQGLMLGCYQLEFPEPDIKSWVTLVPKEDDSVVYPSNNPLITLDHDFLNVAQWPISGENANNSLLFKYFLYGKLNWRKYPLYARGGGYNINSPELSVGFPHNFASLPFTFLSKRSAGVGGKERLERMHYMEQYPGVRESFILTGDNNNGYPQKMSWGSRGLYSFDYHFNKAFTDAEYAVISWAKLGFTDWSNVGSPYIENELNVDTTPSDPDEHISINKYRPYILGSTLNQYLCLKDTNTAFDYVRYGIRGYGVSEWETADKKGFISFAKQGQEGVIDCLAYIHSEDAFAAYRDVYNRAIAWNKYIGMNIFTMADCVRTPNDITNPILGTSAYTPDDPDLLNHLISIYRDDPIPATENNPGIWGAYDITKQYDIAKIDYFRISYPVYIAYKHNGSNQPIIDSFYYPNSSDLLTITIDEDGAGDDHTFDYSIADDLVTCFRGDCYLGVHALKTMINPDGHNPPPDEKGWNGLDSLTGLTTEFDIGIEKNGGGANDYVNYYPTIRAGFGHTIQFIAQSENNVAMRVQLENAKESFWNHEKTAAGDPDFHDFSVQNLARESDVFNKGYNRCLGDLMSPGYDSTLPYIAQNFLVKVAFSEEQNDGDYLDSYRKFYLQSYQQYEHRLGAITALKALNGKLLMIQEAGVSALIVNERASVQTSEVKKPLIIGIAAILSPTAENYTDGYGCQHEFSLVKTPTSLYGWDIRKKKGWRINGQGFNLLTDTKQIKTMTTTLLDLFNKTSNINNIFPNSPYCNQGVVAGYDKRTNEILTTFNFSYDDGNGRTDKYETLVFNENIDAYDYRATFYPPMYLSIGNDLYTCNRAAVKDFYIHNNDAIRNTFYGVKYPFKIKIIVNGAPDGVDNEKKVFDSLEISTNNVEPQLINFTDMLQSAIHSPFTGLGIADEYHEPAYRENKWYVPIMRATIVSGAGLNIFQTESAFRDKYLEIELQYNTDTEVWIKSIINNYRISIR